MSFVPRTRPVRAALLALAPVALGACAAATPGPSSAGQPIELAPAQAPTYADLVTFALAADTVAVVQVDEQIEFPAERAMDVPTGKARLYIEALTQALLASPRAIGESMVFVTDAERDADGDVPDFEGRSVIVFADIVPTRPGEVQLVASNAMFPAGPVLEGRVRRVLEQLAAGDTPPAITGVRDVISVPGNLAGESETQMFVETASGAPVSLSVVRRPGMTPEWGVSLGEIVDTAARPPERESLAWFRLACSLPRSLPSSAFLQNDRESIAQAQADYAFVLESLGPCERRFTS